MKTTTKVLEKTPRTHPEKFVYCWRLIEMPSVPTPLSFIPLQGIDFRNKTASNSAPEFATEIFLAKFSVAPELAKKIKFLDFHLSCGFEFPKTTDLKALEALCDSLAVEGISASIKRTSSVFGPMLEIAKPRKELETWLEEQISYARPR